MTQPTTIKQKLKALIGAEPDDSHVSQVKTWREFWDNANAVEMVVGVRQDNSTKAISSSEATRGSAKKSTFKAHRQAAKKWAVAMFNEHTKLQVDPDVLAEKEGAFADELAFLEQHFSRAGLWPAIERRMIEVFGIGTKACVTEYSSLYGVQHKWFSAENIWPLAVRDDEVKSACFVSTFKKNGKEYTLYNVHTEKLGTVRENMGTDGVKVYPAGTTGYTISNFLFAKEGGEEVDVKTIAGIEPSYTANTRMFAIFRPFTAEVDGFIPALGVPIWAGWEDMVTEIDELYHVKNIDTQTSRRAVIVDRNILSFDSAGRANLPQWLHSIVISFKAFVTGKGGGEEQSFIKEFAPTPHSDLYSAEMKAATARFSVAVGLGADGLKFESTGIHTATQVVSDNQDMFRNLKKHISVMSREFLALNQAILEAANKGAGKFNVTAPIGFYIQDSVVVDDETRREKAAAEVGQGLRSVMSYLEEFRGLSGKELKEEEARISGMNSADLQAEIDKMMGEQAEQEEEAAANA